jgi:hypothetical protein
MFYAFIFRSCILNFLFFCLLCYSGIACITLSFVDAQGGAVVVPAQDCTALQKQNPFNTPLHPDQFEELTAVFKMDSSNSLSGMVCYCMS